MSTHPRRPSPKALFAGRGPKAAPSADAFATVPKELTELDQWVLWRYEHDTKRPYSARTRKLARSNDRSDWVSFDEVLEIYQKYPEKYSGIGFVFAPDDGLAGIDLDDCIEPSGSMKPWAQKIMWRIQSYAEISPSGQGVKIWTRAKLPDGAAGVKRYLSRDGNLTTEKQTDDYDGAIEMYDHGRYFAVTGRPLEGIAIGVEDCHTEVERLYDILRAVGAAGRPAQRTIPEQLEQGSRHPNLLAMGAFLWGKGFSPDSVLSALRIENKQRCKPPKPDKEIQDILTWLSTKPQGAIPDVPRASEPAGSAEPSRVESDFYVIPGDDSAKQAPNDIARLIMRDHRLLVCRDLIYEYDSRCWQRIKDGTLAQYALALDSHLYTKQRRRAEAVNYVITSARNDSIEWRNLDDLEVPCYNGVVNIETCAIRPHRPEDYLESVIPHSYEPGQHPHLWLATLERWFRGDPDRDAKIDALQEFFGYCLLPHGRFKRALFLHGESDTGKSQIPLVLKALVGQQNICTLNTEQMADERKRAPIVGKMINLMTELPVDAMIADGGFKQLVSTGDPISIDPKYVDQFSYVPFCKHLICTNNLPAIQDQTKATYNRLLLIKFNNVIPKSEQDDQLIDKLTAEIQGILAWAIEGAARLVSNRGKFTDIEESTRAVTEYRQSQNPVFDFIAECCYRYTGEPADMNDDWYVPVTEFRTMFSRWLHRPVSPQAMRRMLESAGLVVSDKKIGGRVLKRIAGIAWAAEVRGS